MALWHTMMMTFTARDMATSVIRGLERSLGKLGPAAATAAKGVAGAFIAFQGMQGAAAAIGGFYNMAEGAGRFEQRLGQLRVAAKHADSSFMGLAKAAALNAGLTSRSTPIEAAEGMRELAKAGLEARDVLGMINEALQLTNASAGELSTKQAAEFMAQVKNTFERVGAPSAKLTVNVAAKVAMESMADLSEVPGMISRITRGSMPMEQAFTDVAAVLGVVRGVITSSETAATSLGMVMQTLSTQSGIEKFMKATGVSVKDAAGKFKPLLTILAEMQESPLWKSTSGSEQNEFLKKLFGSRQIGSVQAALSKLASGVKDDTGKIRFGIDAANMLSESYKRAGDQNLIDEYAIADLASLGGVIDFLGAKFKTFRDLIGDAFLPTFKLILTGLNTAMKEVGQLILSMPAWVKEGAAKFILFGLAALTASFAVGALVFTFVALKAVFAVFGAGIFLFFIKPMLIAMAVIGVLTLIGATFYAAWKRNIGGFADLFTGGFEKIKLAFQVFKQLFTEGGTWGDVDKQIMDPKNSGLLVFIKQVWMWLGRIKEFAKGVWDGFLVVIEGGMMETLVEVWKLFVGLLGITDSSVAENVSTWEKMAAIGRVVGKVLGWVANIALFGITAALGIVTVALRVFQGLWWLLGPLVKSVLNVVWGLVQVFVGLITLDFEMLGNGIFTVFKSVGSMILNLFGTIFKFLGAGIDKVVGIFGFKPNFGGRTGAYFGEQDDSLMAQKFSGATPFNQTPKTALGAIQGQASAGAAAGTSNMSINPSPVILNLDGKAIASGVIKYQHGVDNRNFMSVGPLQSREGI